MSFSSIFTNNCQSLGGGPVSLPRNLASTHVFCIKKNHNSNDVVLSFCSNKRAFAFQSSKPQVVTHTAAAASSSVNGEFIVSATSSIAKKTIHFTHRYKQTYSQEETLKHEMMVERQTREQR
ncbi:hypothetical protein ACOSQ4_016237 [Xanthoceras sorbifolium]